jgi:hypothetical protein
MRRTPIWHTWRRASLPPAIAFVVLASTVSTGWAQEPDRDPVFAEIGKRVALDPTTYAPAAIVYSAKHLDWKSSQALFRVGYLEANPRYTISGLPGDTPIGYGAGQRNIAGESATIFGWSVANNASCALVERLLIDRAPGHRKLIRTLGWIERVSFASYWSYRRSVKHFEQWQANERLARQLGAR